MKGRHLRQRWVVATATSANPRYLAWPPQGATFGFHQTEWLIHLSGCSLQRISCCRGTAARRHHPSCRRFCASDRPMTPPRLPVRSHGALKGGKPISTRHGLQGMKRPRTNDGPRRFGSSAPLRRWCRSDYPPRLEGPGQNRPPLPRPARSVRLTTTRG